MTLTSRPAYHADEEQEPGPRRSGELNARELLRWAWRQLTSMRTALILLLLLALAAIPGSIIPQSNVDALKTANWKQAHPSLTPYYDRLHLFAVYDSPWFAAIYLLLMVSLVGCIIPRCVVYARALRTPPPAAPRNLSRLPDHTTFAVADEPAVVLERARSVLRRRRYRVRRAIDDRGDAVSAEKGYLREVGNLLFHLSVLVVLVGFALGGLFGFKGGVIVLVGGGFSNNVTQYDDFDPGSLFDVDAMQPFSFHIDSFSAQWLTSGPRAGMARDFKSELTYRATPGAAQQSYDLRVNHPLTIGGTELFLIGHGYAPIITIRDATGHVVVDHNPVVFLPLNSSFESVGVVKAQTAKPEQLGLEGEFYPTYVPGVKGVNGGLPISAFGNALDPRISMLVYAGDLGLKSGVPQSIYQLDKQHMQLLTRKNGQPYRLTLKIGKTATLPGGRGTVTFNGLERWNKIQISHTPGTKIALAGVSLALVGLLGSLFIRPRRVWVRVRRRDDGTSEVELAGLDRSGGGDVPRELAAIQAGLVATTPSSAGHTESGTVPSTESGTTEKENRTT